MLNMSRGLLPCVGISSKAALLSRIFAVCGSAGGQLSIFCVDFHHKSYLLLVLGVQNHINILYLYFMKYMYCTGIELIRCNIGGCSLLDQVSTLANLINITDYDSVFYSLS